MKTTIDLPDATLRQAKTAAAARGVTLKRFFIEALEEQFRRCASDSGTRMSESPWMGGFGALSACYGSGHVQLARNIDGLCARFLRTEFIIAR